jgi:hypothetical protein
MKKYKIKIGQWTIMYEKVEGFVVSDEVPTQENIEKIISEKGLETIREELDWSTQEIEKLDIETLQVLGEVKDEK